MYDPHLHLFIDDHGPLEQKSVERVVGRPKKHPACTAVIVGNEGRLLLFKTLDEAVPEEATAQRSAKHLHPARPGGLPTLHHHLGGSYAPCRGPLENHARQLMEPDAYPEAQFGMEVESVAQSERSIEVITTGARFQIDPAAHASSAFSVSARRVCARRLRCRPAAWKGRRYSRRRAARSFWIRPKQDFASTATHC